MDGHGDRLGDSAPYGRVEYAYSLMARAAGIDMTACRLLAEGPRRHFMTRRFDRGEGGQRHHMISLCALAQLDYNLIATHSYDQYLQTVVALGLGPEALAQAFRRMVFNVMAANCDDHTKNLAFVRPEGADWQLAPAYDVTHAYRPESEWTSRHLMAVSGKFEDIDLDDIYGVGQRADVPGYRKVVREVRDAVDEWTGYAASAEIDDDTTKAVATDIERFRPR
jgi:serine/threonine-protein kinase HipA